MNALPPSCFVVLAAALFCTACKPAPSAPAPTPLPIETVQVDDPDISMLTYNVLADADGVEVRIPALMNILERQDADVVALQEAAPWFIARLRAQPWIGKYRVAGLHPDGYAPGGLLILSKLPVRSTHFETLVGRQGRGVLVAVLDRGGRSMAVAAVHLESFLKDGPTRAMQMKRTFELLAPYDDAVLIGDYNFGDGEQPETATMPAEYKDAWPMLRSGEPGHTWDMAVNPMAKAGAFVGEGSRRLDRIIVRSPSLRPVSTAILGSKPVVAGGRWFPSDHFGLVAVWSGR